MFDLDLYVLGLGVALALALIAWLIHIPLKDAGIADTFWSLLLLATAVIYGLAGPLVSDRAVVVLLLVTLWAARLSVFITRRN